MLLRAIVVLAVVIIGSLSLLALGGWRVAAYVAGWSDLASYHLPKYAYVAERLRAGALPLWNPWEFGGIPFLASLQPGVFYPPVPFFYTLWSGETAHLGFFALHLGISALGSLLLLRSFGCAPWPSVLASLWVTQPLWLARIYDHPNFIATVCWIPWLIYFLRRCLQEPSLRAACGLALVAALQFLAGYPPATFATVYLLLLGVPFWIAEAWGDARAGAPSRRVLALAIAGAVCVLLVAAQLLPTAELALLTNRQGEAAKTQEILRGLGDSSSTFFLVGMPQMRLGGALLEFWRTFGPVLIALGIVAVVAGRRRAPVWYLVVAVVLSGLLPYPAYGKLPLYGHVRWALEWHLIAPQMVFALAALGLDALIARGTVRVTRVAAWSLAIALVSLAWNWHVVDARWLKPQGTVPPPVPDWAWRACDLDDQRFRAYWPQGLARATLLAARVRSIGGYDQSLLPARTARLNETIGIGNGAPQPRWAMSTAQHANVVARMALRCLITPVAPILESGGFTRTAPPDSPLLVYTSARALPRARLVRSARFVASPEAALDALATAGDDEVVLEGPEDTLPDPSCSGAPGSATITADGTEEVRITTDAPCASRLVLADGMLRGWTATVDGVATPIRIADYAFRAVTVPAGRHEVVFRYAPWTVPVGLVLSALGLLAAAALVVLPERYDPVRRAPSGPFAR